MRRGIVLMMTLGILMMLSAAILLLLKENRQIQKDVRRGVATLQSNLLLNDLSGYLKQQSFTPEDLFYGAGLPVRLDLGPVTGMMVLDSAQSRLNINRLLKHVMKEQQALESLLAWMEYRHLRQPQLLLALLLDSYDTDLYERQRGSEIRQIDPAFQNGSIPNSRAMATILSLYALYSGDRSLSLDAWEEVFGYEGSLFDLNYATAEQLMILYPHLPASARRRLANHPTLYTTLEDLPLSADLKADLLTPRMGITPTLTTDTARIRVDFNTTQGCYGTLRFDMTLKKRKILFPSLSPVQCGE